MKGFIKDFRKELQSDIWLMPPLYHRVWQYLKYKANHKENKIPMRDGSFFTVMPGQHLTSIRNIAKGVGWYERGVFKEPNPRTISNILEWLSKQSMINIDRGKGNRQYTLITLSNWGSYQSKEDESNSKYTDGTYEGQQSVHINKNDKECIKNDKEDISTTTREKKNDAINFYQNNIGLTRPDMAEEMLDFINDLGDEMVIEALKRSIDQNKPKWGYAKGILNSWYNKGIKTMEQVKADDVEFQNQQASKSRGFQNKEKGIVPDWFDKRKPKEDKQPSEPVENIDEILNQFKQKRSNQND